MRVVLDTNILISACLKPQGNEAQMVRMAGHRKFLSCVSYELLGEYRDVLFREKFAGFRALAEETLQTVEAQSMAVVATGRVFASLDEADNRVLECAAAAAAHYLVTGNLKHFPVSWGVTKIVNARTFLDTEFPA